MKPRSPIINNAYTRQKVFPDFLLMNGPKLKDFKLMQHTEAHCKHDFLNSCFMVTVELNTLQNSMNLIGQEKSTSFLYKSLGKVKQNQKHFILQYTFNSLPFNLHE